MARRLGRRKAPLREDYMLKEQTKVDSGIFDTKTMVFLSKFFNKGIIEKLDFVIARGKEADLYIANAGASDAVRGNEYVILKFFRIETSSFFKMADYMLGDPRFTKISPSKYGIVREWCKKEFGNLKIAQYAGVRAPVPFMFNGSILAMSLIGKESTAAPQLKDTALEDPTRVLRLILSDIKKLYKNNLVHADISEYNILISDGIPYMIDFGQAVVLKHPNAMKFLHRDVTNILDYFAKRYEIRKNVEEEIEKITGAVSGG